MPAFVGLTIRAWSYQPWPPIKFGVVRLVQVEPPLSERSSTDSPLLFGFSMAT